MLLTVVFAFALLSSVHAGNSSELISKAEYEEMKLTIEEMKQSFEERLSALETQKSQSMSLFAKDQLKKTLLQLSILTPKSTSESKVIRNLLCCL